jgi:hypothetical protein
MKHPLEFDLALYAGGELSGLRFVWRKMRTAAHVRRCEQCHSAVEAFRESRFELIDAADKLPPGVNWEQLSAEMSANIHLGLEAGECVSAAAPVKVSQGPGLSWGWRPVAAAAALVVVMGAAWWLNVGGQDKSVMQAALNRLFHGKWGVPAPAETVVEASSQGAELRENGDVLQIGVGQIGVGDEKHISSTVSFDGSASARYIDGANFQMTIAVVSTR